MAGMGSRCCGKGRGGNGPSFWSLKGLCTQEVYRPDPAERQEDRAEASRGGGAGALEVSCSPSVPPPPKGQLIATSNSPAYSWRCGL